jgi:hypothetical protein
MKLGEFGRDRPAARNAIPDRREVEALRLLGVRLQKRRHVAGLARP